MWRTTLAEATVLLLLVGVFWAALMVAPGIEQTIIDYKAQQ